MAENRYFSGSSGSSSGQSPAPFPGRTARGRASGSTTYFGGASSVRRAQPSSQRTAPRPADAARQPAASAASPSAHTTRTAAKEKRGSDKPVDIVSSKNSERSSQDMKKQKKGVRGGRILLAVILILILLITGSGAALGAYVLKDYHSVELADNTYISADKLKSSKSVTNILLMGVDTEHTSDSTRSDAMIVVSIDTKNKKIKLTSFLRDMYITVPGHGETKLTHACSYKNGGPQLTRDTIELNFGIRIDGYAKIGYDICREVVDAVGGITVAEIDKTESKALARENVKIAPGKDIHLDGQQALIYCRIRKGQSDFDRTERQREVITLVLNKIKKMNPAKLVKLVSSVASEIVCTIPKNDLIKLGLNTLPCLLNSIEQTKIPTDGSWSYATRDGMSVVLVDLEKNNKFLLEWLYGE